MAPEQLDEVGEPVPRLPRSRGFRLSRPQLVRIVLTGLLLVMLIVIQKPCADSVSSFVTGFGDDGSAKPAMPTPGTVDQPAARPEVGSAADYERVPDHMTEADYKAMVERQKAKQAAKRAASGSSAGSSAGSGQ